MKKTNVFFMKLLIGIILLGFSGQSSAYDLSKWTSKPVEWVKHIAQWFGYEDKDDNKPATDSPAVVEKAEPRTNQEERVTTATTWNTRDISDQVDSDLYYVLDTYSFNHEIPDNGTRVSSSFNNISIDLYGSHLDTINAQAFTNSYFDPLATSSIEQNLNGYKIRNSNVAARLSYRLPFLRHLHQGAIPAISLESSYRFEDSLSSHTGPGLQETDYRWRTGLRYRGSNLINLPASPVGINWGAGYDYNVATDKFNALQSSYESYGFHSGNIFAGSYWYNLKLYTMFMYRYDIESSGSMTTFSATYSPSLRWTYGIRANFYNGSKDINVKGINGNPELVSFTATYRWD